MRGGSASVELSVASVLEVGRPLVLVSGEAEVWCWKYRIRRYSQRRFVARHFQYGAL